MIEVKWDEIRLAWAADLRKMGPLTDHSQSLPDDDKWNYLTAPAFGILQDASKKYIVPGIDIEELLITKWDKMFGMNDQDIQLTQDTEPYIVPDWYINMYECLGEEGSSPRQMQLRMISILTENRSP